MCMCSRLTWNKGSDTFAVRQSRWYVSFFCGAAAFVIAGGATGHSFFDLTSHAFRGLIMEKQEVRAASDGLSAECHFIFQSSIV